MFEKNFFIDLQIIKARSWHKRFHCVTKNEEKILYALKSFALSKVRCSRQASRKQKSPPPPPPWNEAFFRRWPKNFEHRSDISHLYLRVCVCVCVYVCVYIYIYI